MPAKPAAEVPLPEALSPADRASLEQLARASLAGAVLERSEPGAEAGAVGPVPPRLARPGGVFVTIYTSDGALRGCVGLVRCARALSESVPQMASAAAIRDPRFDPVEARELSGLRLEISLLGPLVPVADRPADGSFLSLGEHGVYVRRDKESALLLPQVAERFSWTAPELLQQSCAKAGLPPGTWLLSSVELFLFRTLRFSFAAARVPSAMATTPRGEEPGARGVLRRLEQAGLRPRRRLGQHFLVDPSILARIAAAADLGSGDTVLEVGTGPGTLTRHLCAAARQVISIELDERMLEFARGELAGQANLELLCGDVLERKSAVSRSVLQRLAAHASAKVVANLPYSVATPFLVGLFEQAPQVTLAVVLVQREVALRLVAAPGGGAYGPPTLLLGYWARASMLWDVPAGAFVPPPRVTSTLVRLARRDAPLGSREAYPAYAAWVRRLFSQRRKQLGGSLRRRLGPVAAEQALERLGVDGATRVESLPAGAFLRLAREFGAPG